MIFISLCLETPCKRSIQQLIRIRHGLIRPLFIIIHGIICKISFGIVKTRDCQQIEIVQRTQCVPAFETRISSFSFGFGFTKSKCHCIIYRKEINNPGWHDDSSSMISLSLNKRMSDIKHLNNIEHDARDTMNRKHLHKI